MNSLKHVPGLLILTLLPLCGAAQAADSPALAAPVYKGAEPAVPSATGDGGTWYFLSRDPIDKVKAFYEKSIGATHPIQGLLNSQSVQGHVVLAERAWYPGDSETLPGFIYRGVSLHALPPPPVKGNAPAVPVSEEEGGWAGQEVYQFYASTRHFGGFIDGVDWFGEPGKRKSTELDAVYSKYGHLEAALFQRKGAGSEAVDVTLRARYADKQNELRNAAYSGAMPSEADIQQMQMAARTAPPASANATPEDAAFEALMRSKPEVARRYSALSRQLGDLMQQGKWDEADEVDEQLEELIAEYPELAALEEQEDARNAQASAAGAASESQQQSAQEAMLDKANWATWMEYIQAADKEAYYTLIVIDEAFLGNEKDYSRDQTLIAPATAVMVPHQSVWEFRYNQPADGATPVAAANADQPAAPEEAAEKDSLQENAKKGWRALKKVF